jgi:hypothetical protein
VLHSRDDSYWQKLFFIKTAEINELSGSIPTEFLITDRVAKSSNLMTVNLGHEAFSARVVKTWFRRGGSIPSIDKSRGREMHT